MQNINNVQDEIAKVFGYDSMEDARKHLQSHQIKLIYEEAGYRFGRNVQDACAEIVRGYPHLEKQIAQLNLNS